MRIRLGASGWGTVLRRGGAVVVLVAATVAIASAQAGTQTKYYAASIYRTSVAAGTTNARFTLTLTNSDRSTQTLGSANFSAPPGWTIGSPASGASTPADDNAAWTVTNAANTLELRANSSGAAIAPGQSVSATVTTSVPCSASSPATWTTIAKQSNSFNGPPGNSFVRLGDDPTVTVTQGDGSLGSLVVGHIADQAKTVAFNVTVTAKDTCGNVKTNYDGGAVLGGTLTGSPTYGALDWSSGVGTGSVTASDSQTGATVTATDGSVSGTSNAFDVFDAICTSGSNCHESSGDGSTTVDSQVDSAPNAQLGLMFSTPHASFTCNSASRDAVGSLVTLVPSNYGASPYLLTLTYSKTAAPGTGVANFVVCLGKNGTFTQLNMCKNARSTPCIVSRNRTGVGQLVIVLRLDPSDPVGGTYR